MLTGVSQADSDNVEWNGIVSFMSPTEPSVGNIKPLPKVRDSVAVAIQQDDGARAIPKVVAGGKGHIARQILEIAFQNGIKVREDADLAELLSVVDVGSEIPLDAFAAVAEILTYIYQINNAMAANHPAGSESEHEKTGLTNGRELATAWAKTSETSR